MHICKVIPRDNLRMEVPLEQVAIAYHRKKTNEEESLNLNMLRRKHKFTVHLKN